MFNSKTEKFIIIKVDNQYDNVRLDRFLRGVVGPINQAVLEKALRQKNILINNKKAKSSERLEIGQIISYSKYIFIENSKKEKLVSNEEVKFYKNLFKQIVISNSENMIVLNKPNNIAVQGGTNQKFHIDNFLKANFNNLKETPKLVHRLDKDTSGLLLIAKNLITARSLTKMFKEGNILKIYYALVSPCPPKNEGTINLNIDKRSSFNENKMFVSNETGKNSLTKYVVIDNIHNELALVALYPITGRTHQLRLHMNYLGCPIIGDKKYFDKSLKKNITTDKNLKLHAAILKIPKKNIFKAELPKHFSDTLDFYGLRLNKVENILSLFVKG